MARRDSPWSMRADGRCRQPVWSFVCGSPAMASDRPLSPIEDALWRATMRIVNVLPAQLDSDLLRGAGLSASEYTTLLNLGEAPDGLRMTDLATSTGLSTNRTSRLVDELQVHGLVTRLTSSADARSTRAVITSKGTIKLRSAWHVHLDSVRSRFFDHVDASCVDQLADALSQMARQL
jgi:DNA-binding MarR family transcriptional regulator